MPVSDRIIFAGRPPSQSLCIHTEAETCCAHAHACRHTRAGMHTIPEACHAPHCSDQRLSPSVPVQAHSPAGRRARSCLDERVHGIPGFEGSSPSLFGVS